MSSSCRNAGDQVNYMFAIKHNTESDTENDTEDHKDVSDGRNAYESHRWFYA